MNLIVFSFEGGGVETHPTIDPHMHTFNGGYVWGILYMCISLSINVNLQNPYNQCFDCKVNLQNTIGTHM